MTTHPSPAAPTLGPADLALLSPLLDQALDLPIEERQAWLDALPPEHAKWRSVLVSLLFAPGGTGEASVRLTSPGFLPSRHAVGNRAGEQVGPYRLLAELGQGGMGSVWLAERADGRYERRLALKLPRIAWSEGLDRRMARESRIGALLEHPSIARLYDAGLDEHGRPYIAMEYVDGVPIDAYVERERLPPRAIVALMRQVARAVAHAHGKLVIHRDLKPANILVDAQGHAHLLDFGIAKLLDDDGSAAATKLTQELGTAMTPAYAAPEQIGGHPIGVQADVYAMGVVLHQLLTGVLPYEVERRTLAALERAMSDGDPPPPSRRTADRERARALSGDLDAIVGKALKVRTSERYASAEAFADDLDRWLGGWPIQARPDGWWYRAAKAARRHRAALGAVAAVLLAVGGGAAVSVQQLHQAAKAAERERVVKALVTELFRKSGGQGDAGRPASETLLENGAELIASRFENQPDLQAELFGTVAAVYQDMGAPQQAADYAERRLALLPASDLRQRYEALMALARAAVDDRDLVKAARAAADAEAIAASDLDRIDAAVLQARALFRTGPDAHRTAFDRARSALEALPPGAARSDRARVAGLWLASVECADLWQQGQRGAAIQRLQALDGDARALGEAGAEVSRSLRVVLGYYLMSYKRKREGLAYGEAVARELERLGVYASVRATMLRAEMWTGALFMPDPVVSNKEVLSQLEQARRRLDDAPVTVPRQLKDLLMLNLSYVLVQYGRVEDGWSIAQGVTHRLLERARTQKERVNVISGLAWAAVAAGAHDVAASLLRRKIEISLHLGGGFVPGAADYYVEAAINELAAGRHEAALRILDEVPAFTVPKDDPYSDHLGHIVQLARLQILLDAGRVAAVLPHRPMIARMVAMGDDAFYQTLLGELDCLSGHREAGLRELDRVRHSRGPDQVDRSIDPVLARATALAGRCALGAGQRAKALEYARLAHDAFHRQPGVSPWFKKPLVALERELGLKPPAAV
ncbi:MAG: serine/threonine-protein kinase [Rubrivivax sp.]